MWKTPDPEPAWLEKIANGNVCVSPEIFPAKEMVAPNSPKLRANAKIAPLITPGNASGKVMVKNTRKLEAPKVLAASSIIFIYQFDRKSNGTGYQRK